MKREAELSTNSHLMVSWVRWERKMLERTGVPIFKVFGTCALGPSGNDLDQELFYFYLWQNLNSITREALSMNGPFFITALLRKLYGRG